MTIIAECKHSDQRIESMRVLLAISIEVDRFPLYHEKMRALRLRLTEAGDDAWLRERGWHVL